jgi:fumarylacetoacetase
VRRAASRLLRTGTAEGAQAQSRRDAILVGMSQVTPLVPAEIGDFTDFYASIFHATNVGAMFRPDNPLMPNYKYVPVGYHGRTSSIVASDTAVQRPRGQTRPDANADPVFGPSKSLDYELELGAWVCGENAIGQSVPLASAEQRIFGLSLLNDWSARDIQSWEYQPLGPFLAKNFATSVGTWVVTLDALAPFRAPSFARPPGDPMPLPYLDDADDRSRGGFDITLEAWLRSSEMRRTGQGPVRLSRANFTTMFWTFAQMLTHHASNGCNLRPGDLIGSGTVSGHEPDSRGCLLELAKRGVEPIALPSGETRAFLADGDEVVLRGWCERAGAARIGFGECRGEVRAAT